MKELSILLVRRDNIGDLLCTTPLIDGLRKRYPRAFLAVLASSYNAEVLDGNPQVDRVFIFPKKHEEKSIHYFFSKLWKRWLLVEEIKKYCFDYVILANGGWRYGRRLGGKQTIGFRERKRSEHQQPSILLPLEKETQEEHEVLKMARLGALLGVQEATGPLHIFPQKEECERQQKRLLQLGWDPSLHTIGLHISSRRPEQRWPKEFFVTLARELMKKSKNQIFLFWSPGNSNNRMHPGDDEKAMWILEQLKGKYIFPCPTKKLRELIASLSLVDQIICSDGGAMHVAAALQKPILCFFGTSDLSQWHPWRVPYEVLQPVSKNVADIRVEDVLEKLSNL